MCVCAHVCFSVLYVHVCAGVCVCVCACICVPLPELLLLQPLPLLLPLPLPSPAPPQKKNGRHMAGAPTIMTCLQPGPPHDTPRVHAQTTSPVRDWRASAIRAKRVLGSMTYNVCLFVVCCVFRAVCCVLCVVCCVLRVAYCVCCVCVLCVACCVLCIVCCVL